jgi:CubicO group peptidase (beta-lactamase class C family)
MKKFIAFPVLVFLVGFSTCSTQNNKDLPNGTNQSTPEEEGISSGAILEFIEALEAAQPDALHSLIIRRHGNVVAQGWWEPYAPDTPHLLWSLSKSFTSTAIGIAQDEGLLSIDDPVISFFPDEVPEEPSVNLEAMRIRDLLRMNTGQAEAPSFRNLQTDNWVRAFLEHPVEFKPGTHFAYNSMATYMCSAILQKVTGKTLLEYLSPRLFEPLGIRHPTWESDPMGINVGGWGLSLTTEDISRFGQLMLQNGLWSGRQLVSETWVNEATGLQSSNGSNPESDWDQGYGYQFWRCRNKAYRGDGAFGQYCIVMPEQDAVIAITSGSDDMQGILNIVWEKLLPAMEEQPLPADNSGLEALNKKLDKLSFSYLNGEENSPLLSEISGKTYLLEQNELSLKSLSFNFEARLNEVRLIAEQGEHIIQVGFGNRERGTLGSPYVTSDLVAVDGAWTAPDTYSMNLIYYETPESVKFTFRFEEDYLLWDTERKASFGPSYPVQVKGILK